MDTSLRAGAGFNQFFAYLRSVAGSRISSVSLRHTKADPLQALSPKGYRAVAGLEGTRHGGGVVIAARQHLLVDEVNMRAYTRLECAEMAAIEYGGRTYICYYT